MSCYRACVGLCMRTCACVGLIFNYCPPFSRQYTVAGLEWWTGLDWTGGLGKVEGELGERLGSKEDDMFVVSQPTCTCNMYDVCRYMYTCIYMYTFYKPLLILE